MQPLFEVKEMRDMTVGELISELKGYPPDSPIRVNIDNRRNQLLEIKDVSTVIDMDTNKAYPVLHIDKIGIEEK